MAVRLNKAAKQSVSLLSGFKHWGDLGNNKNNNSEVTLPITFASALYVVVIVDTAANGYPLSYGVYQLSSKSFYAYARRIITGNIEKKYTGDGLLLDIRQWIYQSGSGTQAQITLPISLANYGTVVGIDGSVIDIHYAAYVHDRSIINVYTNTTGVWGFRAIIIGY